MRANFFSIILVMLSFTGVMKTLALFDGIMMKVANIETKATTMFMVNSAVASGNNVSSQAASASSGASGTSNNVEPQIANDLLNEAAIEKIASEAKNEKDNLIDRDNKNLIARKSVAANNNQGMQNLLDIGLNSDEIKLLKELSKRREALDNYEQQLVMKESLLKSTESKIQQKMQEMQLMQDRVNDLLKQLDNKSNLRMKSLAKIYENMKPQEAAKIFDELEMPILLDIIRNMKEQKVAAIISQMNPVKAKDVSLDFAKTTELLPNAQ